MSIQIRDLHISVNKAEVVHGVDLDIKDGERVGIIGPSGSGKSMILKAMLGLLPQTSHIDGVIKIEGHNICEFTDVQMAAIRGRYISTIFQNPMEALNPVISVERNITLPLKMHWELPSAEMHQRALAVMSRVGLNSGLLTRKPFELSGGQAQRVAIAAALITSPKVIVADEPTTALDAIVQKEITKLLISCVEDLGASLLFVTHDFSVLKRIASRAYVLENGEVTESGKVEDLLNNPSAQATHDLVNAARTLSLKSAVKYEHEAVDEWLQG